MAGISRGNRYAIKTLRRRAVGRRGASKNSCPGLSWRAHQAGEMSRFVNQKKVSRVVEVLSREILGGELELNFIVADR